MIKLQTSILGLLALAFSLCVLTAPAQAQTSRQVVERAADALGGADRIRNVRNITLHGYGQYAYMYGGGRLTASPDAPEKFIAANDLRRVYDLENGRFQQQERRNMLFPFLGKFGHSYALNTLVLDGDIAFDVQGDRAVRQARFSEGALWVDGVHMRRMWMMNNPVVLIRAAMDPSTKLSAVRREGGRPVIDLTLKAGDRLTAGFDANGRPAFVRWRHPHPNLGEATFTTWFSGYGSFGGVMLPMGYVTRLDWRNVDYFKVYVDAYEIDGKIPDLTAPAAVKAQVEPVSYPSPELTHVQVAPGVWRISNGTHVIAFKDHLTLFELGLNARQAGPVIDYARKLAPGKPVTQLIISHQHFDHIAGIREAMAEGLTIIARRDTGPLLQELAARRTAAEFQDDFTKSPKPLKFMPVDERLRLSDETMTVDLYWARNNIHMADAVFAHIPKEKVIIEGDIATAAFDYQFWPDNLPDAIEAYGLQVDRVSPVHAVFSDRGPVLSMKDIDELLKGGTERARQRCAEELAKGNWFPGCPVHSKRY